MAGGSAFPFPYSELKVYKVKPEDMKPTYFETRCVTLDIAVHGRAWGHHRRGRLSARRRGGLELLSR